MELKLVQREVREFVKKGNIQKALKYLGSVIKSLHIEGEPIYDAYIIIFQEYSSIRESYHKGTLSFESIARLNNRIAERILSFVNSLEQFEEKLKTPITKFIKPYSEYSEVDILDIMDDLVTSDQRLNKLKHEIKEKITQLQFSEDLNRINKIENEIKELKAKFITENKTFNNLREDYQKLKNEYFKFKDDFNSSHLTLLKEQEDNQLQFMGIMNQINNLEEVIKYYSKKNESSSTKKDFKELTKEIKFDQNKVLELVIEQQKHIIEVLLEEQKKMFFKYEENQKRFNEDLFSKVEFLEEKIMIIFRELQDLKY